MKIAFTIIAALMMLICAVSLAEEGVDALTYAVFSYLPDAGYYQELIEQRWAEAEPGIRLIRTDWTATPAARRKVSMWSCSTRSRWSVSPPPGGSGRLTRVR